MWRPGQSFLNRAGDTQAVGGESEAQAGRGRRWRGSLKAAFRARGGRPDLGRSLRVPECQDSQHSRRKQKVRRGLVSSSEGCLEYKYVLQANTNRDH